MKKDLFRRSNRMTHRFGESEGAADPLGSGTFNPQFPKAITTHRSKPLTIQKHGEYRYCPPASGVVSAKGGKASLNGPAPDYAGEVSAAVPMNAKRRKQP